MKDNAVAVLGLGLIGGSLSGALKLSGARVRGYDLSPAHARLALDRGLVDETAPILESAVHDADVVILAVPVLRVIELLPRIDAATRPQALILDTGSVKGPVVDAMAALPGARRAVGGHPFAGKELSGPGAADIDLFRNTPFFLVPSRHTDAEAMNRAEEIASRIGAVPVTMDAAVHDRELAATSHLPQILSSILASCVHPDDLRLVGAGFKGMTRLAASDPSMWRDILLANSGYLEAAGRRYMAELDEMLTAIGRRDAAAIEAILEAGRAELTARQVPV